MTYPPDPHRRPPPVVPGYQQQPRGWPQQPPPAKKRPGPLKWILGSVLVVLALCVGLTVIVGITSGGDNAKRAAVAGGAETTAVRAQPTTAGPATSPITRPAAAVTTKPKPTSAKPKPKPTKTKTVTTEPEPTSDPTHAGVTAGAFCSEHGDYGLTSKGTLMRCKTSATDSRYRWRKA